MQITTSPAGSVAATDKTKPNQETIDILTSVGIASDEIEDAFRGNPRARHAGGGAARIDLPSRIRELKEEICAAYNGRKFQCAKEVLQTLKDNGVCSNRSFANAVGDACGKKGLQLPSVTIVGKRYYDLTAIDLSSVEREERQSFWDAQPYSVFLKAAGLLPASNG